LRKGSSKPGGQKTLEVAEGMKALEEVEIRSQTGEI